MNTTIKSLIENLVEASLEEVLRGFNLQKFKSISAGSARPETKEEEEDFAWAHKSHPEVAYARKYLPELGEGSSRIVFALSGDKVLKISKNKAGIAQNEAEVSIFTHSKNNKLVTRIFDFSPDFKWIISELVKPLGRGEFRAITGIDEDWFTYGILDQESVDHGLESKLKRLKSDVPRSPKIPAIQDVLMSPEKLKFVEDIIEMIKTHNLVYPDVNPSHFGKTINGKLRFFDYGYTEDVYSKYY
jgi:hypothetical protein